MTPLDNLRRLVAGWRGEWRVDAHDGIALSHDGEEWPIDDMDGDVMIALVELLNAIRPAVDGATAEIARLEAELVQAARAFGLVDRECSEAVACREDARAALLNVGIALGIDVPPLDEIEPVRANWQRYAAAALTAAEAMAAARAVPPDVEAALAGSWANGYDEGRADARRRPEDHHLKAPSTRDDSINYGKASITRAISNATATTRADLAVAVHELGEVTRAYHVANDAIGEVCRLVGAESTPGAADVAGNDASTKRDAVAKVRALVAVPPDVAFAIDTGIADFIDSHAKRIAGDDWALMDADDQCSVAAQVHDVLNHLRGGEDGTVLDGRASKPATVGITTAIKSVERIESTSKALGYSADYMAAIDRVLSCMRAVAENGGPLTSTVDGGTSQPATVGGLLATACDRHDGDIIEFDEGSNWMQVVVFGGVVRWRVHDADDGWFPTSSDLTGWHSDEFIAGWLAAPARLVPAHLADADPATRGEIGAAPPANPHPDGCHTVDALALRDCSSDGHHECRTCTRREVPDAR